MPQPILPVFKQLLGNVFGIVEVHLLRQAVDCKSVTDDMRSKRGASAWALEQAEPPPDSKWSW